MCKLLQTSRGKYRIYRCLTNIFVTEQSLNYDIIYLKLYSMAMQMLTIEKNIHNLNGIDKIVAMK